MKKFYFIANWKSYKISLEARSWYQEISQYQFPPEYLAEIVLCPSSILLPVIKAYNEEFNLPIKIGIQDISQFGEGSYTGAVNTRQVAEFATYSIIGHSERRKYFHETDDDVLSKLKILLENNIKPILCISDLKQMEYFVQNSPLLADKADKILFVYEPPGAISGGGDFHPETPETANENAKKISEIVGKQIIILYGGSVNPENIQSFLSQEYICGGLVGQASLTAQKFTQIITNGMK